MKQGNKKNESWPFNSSDKLSNKSSTCVVYIVTLKVNSQKTVNTNKIDNGESKLQ